MDGGISLHLRVMTARLLLSTVLVTVNISSLTVVSVDIGLFFLFLDCWLTGSSCYRLQRHDKVPHARVGIKGNRGHRHEQPIQLGKNLKLSIPLCAKP